jgi:hypothetical protein
MVAEARSSAFSSGPDAVLPALAAFQAARVEFAQEVAKLAVRCRTMPFTPYSLFLLLSVAFV